MISKVIGFDWDEANIEKCQKHGVPIEIIEDFFMGEIRIHPDIAHSSTEDRYIAIGSTNNQRAIFVGFAYRHGEQGLLIRPITARYMHEKEFRKYEKAFAKI